MKRTLATLALALTAGFLISCHSGEYCHVFQSGWMRDYVWPNDDKCGSIIGNMDGSDADYYASIESADGKYFATLGQAERFVEEGCPTRKEDRHAKD
jgi:hypothetical protein